MVIAEQCRNQGRFLFGNLVYSKAYKILGLLNRNLQSCPQKLKELAYKSLIRPILKYACVAWDPHQQYLQKKIWNRGRLQDLLPISTENLDQWHKLYLIRNFNPYFREEKRADYCFSAKDCIIKLQFLPASTSSLNKHFHQNWHTQSQLPAKYSPWLEPTAICGHQYDQSSQESSRVYCGHSEEWVWAVLDCYFTLLRLKVMSNVVLSYLTKDTEDELEVPDLDKLSLSSNGINYFSNHSAYMH